MTLYISDLDGTLLDRQGVMSDYTAATIRRFVDEGGLFSVATARSQQAAAALIAQMGLRLPVVLTNGATVYDPVKATYLQIKSIPLDVLPRLFYTLEAFDICGFLYTMRDDLTTVYYRQFLHEWDAAYHAHRVERYKGRIHQVADLVQVAAQTVPVYVVAYGPEAMLSSVRAELDHLPELSSELYEDVYNHNCFMDIFPSTASKANGMLLLRELTGADELVAFGDNFNDLSMLLAADRSYVPRGAVSAAKNIATAVLDSAHKDSVARFLAREWGFEPA